jgi:hypothetical protein
LFITGQTSSLYSLSLYLLFMSSAQIPKLETIEIILFPNGVAEIAHNRPKRFNALSPQSYRVNNLSQRKNRAIKSKHA